MTTHVELFFDPVCPFCWMTSRWLEEVTDHADVAVRYRPISLRMLNPDDDTDEPLGALHLRGLELLRVVAAVDEAHGAATVARLYTALGEVIHEQPVADGSEFADVAEAQADRPDDVRALLRDLGLPEGLADAGGDDRHDAAIRASTEVAQQRAGDDVGTPIITLDPPTGPSFFGPIMSDFPPGEEAVRLFDAVRVLAEHRPFTELKRSLRAMPETEALAQVG